MTRAICSRVRPGACAEEVVRLADRELVDEHLRHLVVVVLARMDEHVLEIVRPAAQLAHDRRRLHEVRPRADDRQDPGPDRHERRMIESRFRLTSAWSVCFRDLRPTPQKGSSLAYSAPNDCAESRMMRAGRGFPRRSPRRRRRASRPPLRRRARAHRCAGRRGSSPRSRSTAPSATTVRCSSQSFSVASSPPAPVAAGRLVVDEHHAVPDEDAVSELDAGADERVALDLAARPDDRSRLNLDERPDPRLVADAAAVQVREGLDDDALAELDVRR